MVKKTENWIMYIIGSAVVAFGASLVAPKIIHCFSSYLYAKQPRNTLSQNDEDWGPEIIKKEEETKNGHI